MLTPQAYVYLRYPILSSGETMLSHTLQHLCFTGALKLLYEDGWPFTAPCDEALVPLARHLASHCGASRAIRVTIGAG